MNYLARRKGSANFYYRESLPSDVKRILSSRGLPAPTEVWRSLGTADPRVAKEKLAGVRAAQYERWDAIRNAEPQSSELPTPFVMAQAVANHVHASFIRREGEQLRARIEAGLDLLPEAQQRKERIAREALSPSEKDQAGVERFAHYLCRTERWPITPDDQASAGLWGELLLLVKRAIQLARADVVETLEGRHRDFSRDEVAVRLGVTPEKLARPGETIMDLFDLYEAELGREGLKKADTVATERKVLGHFARFVGERRPVADIGPEDMRDFKRALSQVPERWAARPEFKGMSIGDAARKWETAGGSGRSPTTVRRELSAVSTFFRWLKKNAYYSAANPTADFFPAVDKRRNARPPYSREQLLAVFKSPLFHKARDKKPHLTGEDVIRDWRYWLPLCALFTGARAGELAQLSVKDVYLDDETWVFDFNENAGAGDGEVTKSLKTTSSRRIVPVHPKLISLGFSDYVERQRRRGSLRVFPEITPGPRGDMSYAPSKFWQRYLQRIDVKTPGLGLHSFRHTFADECRTRAVPKEVLQALLGHSDGTQTGFYGRLQSGNRDQRRAAVYSLSFYGLANALPEPSGCVCQPMVETAEAA